MNHVTRLVAVSALAGWAWGCGSPDGAAPAVLPEYDATTGKLVRLTYDSDHDGRADMVASMEGRALRVVEVDVDADGLVDRWERYAPASGAGADGPRLVAVEQVSRSGTTIVRREAYEGGELAWVHEDRDGDGRDDRWETYTQSGLAVLALDTDGTGRADRRLRYTGTDVVVEVDPDERGAFMPVLQGR